MCDNDIEVYVYTAFCFGYGFLARVVLIFCMLWSMPAYTMFRFSVSCFLFTVCEVFLMWHISKNFSFLYDFVLSNISVSLILNSCVVVIQ